MAKTTVYKPEDFKDHKLHPKIKEFHNQSGLEFRPSSEYQAREIFEMQATGYPSVQRIEAITRVRTGAGFSNGKTNEYVFYSLAVEGSDENSSPVYMPPYKIGVVDVPVGEFAFDTISRKRKCVGIHRHDKIYTIPWSVEVFDKLVEDGLIDEQTHFFANNGSILYAVENAEWFRSEPLESLIFRGRTGLPPGTPETPKVVAKK